MSIGLPLLFIFYIFVDLTITVHVLFTDVFFAELAKTYLFDTSAVSVNT